MNKFIPAVVALFLFATTAQSEVLFSEDFEWGQDWQYSDGNTVPIANGWDEILMQNRGGAYDVAYVNSLGGKDGGRGFIQYWDTTPGVGGQDAWLVRYDVGFGDGYYIGYYYRVDPQWSWGDVGSLKVFKTGFANGGDTWDVNWVTPGTMIEYCGNSISGWCNVDGSYWTSALPASGGAMSTDMAVDKVVGSWNTINDGNWHYIIHHIDHASGIYDLSIDGVDITHMDDPTPRTAFPYTEGIDDSFPRGWNFGGNITNGGGGKSEMWSAYDKLIIATTEAEVLSFLSATVLPSGNFYNYGAGYSAQ